MGHSISVNPFLEDNPNFAPHVDVTLQPGMVVCIETSYMGSVGCGRPPRDHTTLKTILRLLLGGYERFTTAARFVGVGRLTLSEGSFRAFNNIRAPGRRIDLSLTPDLASDLLWQGGEWMP